MANLSKRAQDTLREEISLVGNVQPAKVMEARQAVGAGHSATGRAAGEFI